MDTDHHYASARWQLIYLALRQALAARNSTHLARYEGGEIQLRGMPGVPWVTITDAHIHDLDIPRAASHLSRLAVQWDVEVQERSGHDY